MPCDRADSECFAYQTQHRRSRFRAVRYGRPRSSSGITILANCTDSLIVAMSLGEGLIGSPRSRIAATMEAAISSAPVWRSGSIPPHGRRK
jgi:hypothetical protein